MTVTFTPKLGLSIPADGHGTGAGENWAQDWREDSHRLEARLAKSHNGNPNTAQAGDYVGQLCWDTAANAMYVCRVAGNAANAQWISISEQGVKAISQGGTGSNTPDGARINLGVPGLLTENRFRARNVFNIIDGYGHAPDSWTHSAIWTENEGGGHAAITFHNAGSNAGALVLNRNDSMLEFWRNDGRRFGVGLPSGTVVMWWGDPANLPIGWVLCNGANGSPDFRNRVPVGAGAAYAIGQALGNDVNVTTAVGNHNHAGATTPGGAHAHDGITQATSLNIGHLPPHTHTVTGATTSNSASGALTETNGNFGQRVQAVSVATSSVGSGAGHAHGFVTNAAPEHAHGINADGAHAHNVDVRQPSLGIHFILKV